MNMVTICKIFDTDNIEEYPMFELLIELLKIGVKSGNGIWAQAYQTMRQVKEIFTRMEATDNFLRLRVALNDLNFGIYKDSSMDYWSFHRVTDSRKIGIKSDIYPDSYKAFIKSQSSNTIDSSCFWEQCRNTLVNIIIPYLDNLGVPYDDLLGFSDISEYMDFGTITLIDSPRLNIYKKFNIERFALR